MHLFYVVLSILCTPYIKKSIRCNFMIVACIIVLNVDNHDCQILERHVRRYLKTRLYLATFYKLFFHDWHVRENFVFVREDERKIVRRFPRRFIPARKRTSCTGWLEQHYIRFSVAFQRHVI